MAQHVAQQQQMAQQMAQQCSFEEVIELVEALGITVGIGKRRWVGLVNRAHTAPWERGRVV